VGGAGPDSIRGGSGNDGCLDSDDDRPGDLINGGPGSDHYLADRGDTVVRAEEEIPRSKETLFCEIEVGA
jgi:hypothetical protein